MWPTSRAHLRCMWLKHSSCTQGTAVTFRQPDSIGGTLFEDE